MGDVVKELSEQNFSMIQQAEIAEEKVGGRDSMSGVRWRERGG